MNWTARCTAVQRTMSLCSWTPKKVVNTSNDMFDENYYRLTILGKGFICRENTFFYENDRFLTENDLFQHKKRNLIEYIIKLIYQSSNVWDEQMYHCIIFDLEWFLILDYHYTGTSMYKVTWLSNMKPFERFSGWFCRFGTWFISSKTSHFWQKWSICHHQYIFLQK